MKKNHQIDRLVSIELGSVQSPCAQVNNLPPLKPQIMPKVGADDEAHGKRQRMLHGEQARQERYERVGGPHSVDNSP